MTAITTHQAREIAASHIRDRGDPGISGVGLEAVRGGWLVRIGLVPEQEQVFGFGPVFLTSDGDVVEYPSSCSARMALEHFAGAVNDT